MKPSITRILLSSVVAAVVCVAAASSPAFAQDKQAKPAVEKAKPSVDTLRAEAMKIARQLNDIENKTLKQDKKLQAKQKHLTDHILKVVKSKGFSPEADQLELMSIRKEIMSGKLKKEERDAKIEEFRAVRARMMRGQQAAMQDEGVRKEDGEFFAALMAAMEKTDPKTKGLLKRQGEIRTEFLALIKAQQKQRQKQQKQAK